MPVQVDDVATLQEYLAGVVQKAGHHAANVRLVVLPLIGAIVLFKNPDTKIEVMTREGEMTNVLWVRISGSRYAFSYEHDSKSIVMKRGTTQGDVLARFTNATTTQGILSVFEALPA